MTETLKTGQRREVAEQASHRRGNSVKGKHGGDEDLVGIKEVKFKNLN